MEHFDMNKRIVYKGLNMSFDKRQYLEIYLSEALYNLNFQFWFNGSINKLSPSYYFNKLNYIEGTYIRKDKFAEMLEDNAKKNAPLLWIDLSEIPLRPLSEDFLEELRRMAREVGFMPITTSRNG